jgi:DNA-binding transcriptional MocR family regulator
MKSNDAGARVVDRRKNWEARVEMAVFKRPSNELSAYDKLVYAILCGHANRDGNAMLYVRTIAEEASCSERQAQRAMSNLEKRGLLVRRAQNHNGRQTFNIYEVYGFDAYTPDEPPAEPAPEAGPGNGSADDGSGVTDSHRRRTVTPPPSDSHPGGDSQSGLNNVFEQRLFNSSKDNSSPLTPQRMEEREKNLESAKPQNQEYDTEGNEAGQNQKASPESELFETIREIYNSISNDLRQIPYCGKAPSGYNVACKNNKGVEP